MTEYFRITGRNLIPFDTQAIVGADHRYVLGQSPGGMDEPMTEAEVRAVLPRLPQKIRGHALKRGLSKITFPFSIKGSSDPDMEDARHDLTETLEDGALYIATQGARGTRAALMVKANNVPAGHESYKTIVYGEAMELGGRAVLGAAIKQHFLLNLQMVLYCEPYWRPDAAVPLGPNEIYCPSFEEDGDADGTADNWDDSLGAELVANPGFETPGVGDPDFWDDWLETAGDGALAHTAVVHAGADACEATAGATANTLVEQSVGVQANRRYKLSFWTRGDAVNAGRYRLYDDDGFADIIALVSTGVTGAVYTEVAVYFVAPAGCMNARIYLHCPVANGGIAYFDDVSIRSAPVLAIETTTVLHGCDSQKVTTDAANEGIESAAIIAPDWTPNLQSAVAYAWICRPAAGSDITVTIQETVGAPGAIAHSHLDAGGWQTAVGKGGQTWSRVVVSSAAGITEGSTYELWIAVTAATGTVFYVDKCFWKWGTTTVPDEWCDHWLVYDHYDAHWLPDFPGGAIAGDEGHINYMDFDDLKGDVEARTLFQIEFEQAATSTPARHLYMARRTRDVICQFLWWLEGEEQTWNLNWVDDIAVPALSAGCCATDTANVAGSLYWTISGASLPAHRGSFDVWASVYTADEVNTFYRCSYSIGGVIGFEPNGWVRQRNPSKWELIHLGTLDFDPYVRTGWTPSRLDIRVEYAKQAGDVAKLDFVWLMPRDEPQTILSSPIGLGVQLGDYWTISECDDFSYLYYEVAAGSLMENPLWVRGDPMTLRPWHENRVYFTCEVRDAGLDDIIEIHGAGANVLQFVVNVAYLPQYISPLE